MRTAQQCASVCHLSSFSSFYFLSSKCGASCPYVEYCLWFGSATLTINKKQIAPSWNQTHFARGIDDVLACFYCCKWESSSGIAPSQLAPETSSWINQRLIYLLAHLRHVEPISVSGTLSNEPDWLWKWVSEQDWAGSTHLDFLDVKLLLPFCNVYLFVRSPQYFWLVHLLISVEMLTYSYPCFRLTEISKERSSCCHIGSTWDIFPAFLFVLYVWSSHVIWIKSLAVL